MGTTTPKQKDVTVKHPGFDLTPAQIARRKFKSALPRPRMPQTRILTPLQAIGETFTLLDNFRDMVEAEGVDAAKTVYAALAYTLPGTAKLAHTLAVPQPGKIGVFCDAVVGLQRNSPVFLGVVLVQVDPDTKNMDYHTVSFVVPFVSGPDAEARLRFAQSEELSKIQRVAERMKGRRK